MLTSTASLLLAVLGLYLTAQSVVNFRAFRRSCHSAAVAPAFNAVTGCLGLLCVVVFARAAARGGLGSPSFAAE